MRLLRIILEALVIGLKIYWAAEKAGRREVVHEINKALDELQKLPHDDIDNRLAIARTITNRLRAL